MLKQTDAPRCGHVKANAAPSLRERAGGINLRGEFLEGASLEGHWCCSDSPQEPAPGKRLVHA